MAPPGWATWRAGRPGRRGCSSTGAGVRGRGRFLEPRGSPGSSGDSTCTIPMGVGERLPSGRGLAVPGPVSNAVELARLARTVVEDLVLARDDVDAPRAPWRDPDVVEDSV